MNRTLEQMLRMYVMPEMKDWDVWLAPCEFAYNNSRHSTTSHSPFQLAYGRHPVVPASLAEPGCGSAVPAAGQFLAERDALRAQAAAALVSALTSQRLASSPPRDFQPGDNVWLSTKNLHKRGERSRKLLPKYIGPFSIVARVGKVAYKLALPAAMGRLHPVFHVGLLAPHVPRPDGASDTLNFDAVPNLPADATPSGAPVPEPLALHQVLRHRDTRLDGHNVREYLASYREPGSSTER
jgi:hypothetical protein